jgi:hypothetical protein
LDGRKARLTQFVFAGIELPKCSMELSTCRRQRPSQRVDKREPTSDVDIPQRVCLSVTVQRDPDRLLDSGQSVGPELSDAATLRLSPTVVR